MADVNPGLEGVLAAETTISLVDGSAGRLLYRGYEIGDLASHGTFDSVTALLLDGEWPAVRAGFEAWLAPSNFDADGRQRRVWLRWQRQNKSDNASAAV